MTVPAFPHTIFEVELSDGSGRITLRWLGRTHIPGIESGRWMIAGGTVIVEAGQRIMYNPMFTLFAKPPEEISNLYALRKQLTQRERLASAKEL